MRPNRNAWIAECGGPADMIRVRMCVNDRQEAPGGEFLKFPPDHTGRFQRRGRVDHHVAAIDRDHRHIRKIVTQRAMNTTIRLDARRKAILRHPTQPHGARRLRSGELVHAGMMRTDKWRVANGMRKRRPAAC